ncbi:VGLL4-like protein [Mya arenaria]|uniref:VGLL4-like protein n=1 Tax=Mya arenaria TaxID=6604 RepID=A0ABY7FXK0_MYAAR|nr:VGLL4-like protein [Mya arenaria]
MLNLDPTLEQRSAMSLLEPRLADLRAGFGGYSFGGPGISGLPPSPLLPLWRAPPPGPPVSLCTIPSCQCALSVSRSYLSAPDLYDYPAYSAYSAAYSWYLKSAQDSLYKGLPPMGRPSPLHDRTPLSGSPPAPPMEHSDHRASPGKLLPTKISKHERVKAWLEVSTRPPKYEKESSHPVNGTTHRVVRSVTPPDYHEAISGEGYQRASYLSSHGGLRTPPPHPPPRYPHPPVDLHHEAPLNLSLSNPGERQGRSASPLSRPSVITCATVPERRYDSASNGSLSPSGKDSEEHFRRSLGHKYPQFLVKSQSVTPSPPPPPPAISHAISHILPPSPRERTASPVANRTSPPETNGHKNVSITGSVDDHFARALGDSTWSALKAKTGPGEPPEPGSVDDHFTKALGDTWLKLKAEKDPAPRSQGGASHQFSLPHGMPQPLGRPGPTSLPHQLPQRPTSASPPSHHSPIIST